MYRICLDENHCCFCEVTCIQRRRKREKDGQDNGIENVNPNQNEGPVEMPVYAQLVFENFMNPYAQVLEQITAINNHQSESGEGHNDNRDRSGGGSSNGGREHEKDSLCKRFNEFRPKCFAETTNPLDANKWVEHMEVIFEVMGCSERQKAILTAFKLEGDAKEWWKAAKKSFSGQEIEITWTFFKGEFIKKFMPDHIKA